MNVLARRTTTVLAVTVALVIGALSIEAAAAAVRGSAPPAGPAVTVQSIQADLEFERARSEALQEQLQRLTIQSTALVESMAIADEQVASDAETADALRADLAKAKRQLAKLQRQMAAAARAGRSTSTTVASRSSGGEDDHGEEDEEHEEDDD